MSLLPPSFSCKCLEILNEQNTLRPESCWSPSSYEVIAHFISTQIFSLSVKHLEYMKFTWQVICYVCDQCDHGWWGPWTQYCHWHASRPAEEGVQAFQIYLSLLNHADGGAREVAVVFIQFGLSYFLLELPACNIWDLSEIVTRMCAMNGLQIQRRRPELRLIIASATLDAESFFNFFDSRQTPPLPICHLLTWESLAGQALCDE